MRRRRSSLARVRDEARRLQAADGMDTLERQRRATSLRTWVDLEGMWNLKARFDPLTGVRLDARLRDSLEALFATSTPDTCPTDPGAKQDHLRALALADLILTGGTTSKPGRPEYLVVVDADDAADPNGPRTEFSIPVEVPWRVLAELAGDADVHTVVVRNGVVLHAPGNLEPRPHHPPGEPGATPSTPRAVRHLCDPRVRGALRPLQTPPRHLVAPRRLHRPRQPPARLLTTPPQHPRLRDGR